MSYHLRKLPKEHFFSDATLIKRKHLKEKNTYLLTFVWPDGNITHITESRFFAQVQHNKVLRVNDFVFIKDKNKLNLSKENLVIDALSERNKRKNIKPRTQHWCHVIPSVKCCICGTPKVFTQKTFRNFVDRYRHGVIGPFCSSSCGAHYRNRLRNKIPTEIRTHITHLKLVRRFDSSSGPATGEIKIIPIAFADKGERKNG